MAQFTFYWRTGERQVLSGDDAADALNKAGYGGGAVRALDFHAKGDNQEYEWDATEREWKRR
jgi:hypothetical protein